MHHHRLRLVLIVIQIIARNGGMVFGRYVVFFIQSCVKQGDALCPVVGNVMRHRSEPNEGN